MQKYALAQIKCIEEDFRENYILESSLRTTFLRIQSRKDDKKKRATLYTSADRVYGFRVHRWADG